MCLAIPGKIISIKNDTAVVNFSGARKKVNISLVKVKKGDYVMIHAGFAIGKLSPADAEKTGKLYNGKTLTEYT